MPDAKHSYVIGERYESFIDAQIASGRFISASEVVRAGLSLLAKREAKEAELRALIMEAEAEIERGEYFSYGSAEELERDILDEAHRELGSTRAPA